MTREKTSEELEEEIPEEIHRKASILSKALMNLKSQFQLKQSTGSSECVSPSWRAV